METVRESGKRWKKDVEMYGSTDYLFSDCRSCMRIPEDSWDGKGPAGAQNGGQDCEASVEFSIEKQR